MAVAATTGPIPTHPGHRLSRDRGTSRAARLLRYLPRGGMLEDHAWAQRHKILEVFLLIHLPALAVFGVVTKNPPLEVAYTVAPIVIFLGLGDMAGLRRRRLASFFITAGIVYCSAALVVLSHGAIEAHFHFFIIIGFIALYQDWFPFLWNIVFVVISHGIGSLFRSDLMFNHHAGMTHPWLWTLIHGFAVLVACIGTVLFWRTTEDETVRRQQGEIDRRKFASELLVNLARRNQSMLYRQLDIINQLEEHEQDPDALAELFRIDHLATRIRRNAESLLVLAGEDPPRIWSKPVRLTDVVRASIAETEDLNRVVFVVDERLAVLGQVVTDLTHLLAELIENAVRSSPPSTRVTIRSTPDVRSPGAVMLTVEDWGVGMRPEDLVAANETLAAPQDIDHAISKRLGLHVISRLSHRYDIQVTLTSTSGAGITAVIMLPPDIFAMGQLTRPDAAIRDYPSMQEPVPVGRQPVMTSSGPTGPRREARRARMVEPQVQIDVVATPQRWDGWWESADGELAVRALPSAPAPHPGAPTVPGIVLPSRDDAAWPRDSTPTPPRSWPQPVNASPEPSVVIMPQASMQADNRSPITSARPVRLNKRTPQASLAPELQRNGTGEREPAWSSSAPAPTSAPEAARAREALSRYQANRQQALADHDTAERDR